MPTEAFTRCPFCEAILPPGSVIGAGLPGVADMLDRALYALAMNGVDLDDYPEVPHGH